MGPENFDLDIVQLAAGSVETVTDTFLKQVVTSTTNSILKQRWFKGTDDGRNILEKLSETRSSQSYVENSIKKTLSIRTIANPEVDTFIDDIYCPLKICHVNSSYPTTIGNNTRLFPDIPITIVGKAGQGKSTILKKLFLEELKSGERFPFLIELRKLEEFTIPQYIQNDLYNYGISCTAEEVSFLLQSNHSILFLDGFDEVRPDLRKKTANEIENTHTRYNSKIVITSRPDTEICRAIGISVCNVLDLEYDDILAIINKISNDDVSKEKLASCLQENSDLKETLISPILVHLFHVSQPHWETIPKKSAEFYKSLFSLLYSRHDLMKNFERPKSYSLPISEVEMAFSTFCYISFIQEQTEFSNDLLHSNFAKALDMLGHDPADTESIVEDILSITGLIKKDGYDTFVFIHRSIQEFHTALFLSRLAEDEKKVPFQEIIEDFEHTDFFSNILQFYKEINPEEFNSFFIFPLLELWGAGSIAPVASDTAKILSLQPLVHPRGGEPSMSNLVVIACPKSAPERIAHDFFNDLKLEINTLSNVIYELEDEIYAYLSSHEFHSEYPEASSDKNISIVILESMTLRDIAIHLNEQPKIIEAANIILQEIYVNIYKPLKQQQRKKREMLKSISSRRKRKA